MPLTDFITEHEVEVSPSEAESARFGYEFGRCIVPMTSPAKPGDVALQIRDRDAEITVLRYPADRVAWFDQLTRQLQGYVLVHADSLVYWELIVGAGDPPEANERITAEIAPNAALIGDLTTRIFTGYTNHYAANPLLSVEAAAAGYKEWAMGTPLDDVVVLLEGEVPKGIATTDSTSDHIEIFLAGVIPGERGRGLYPHILRAVESRAEKDSLPKVVISTQAHNTVVQRAWARYGFLPLTTLTTLHVVKAAIWDRAQV